MKRWVFALLLLALPASAATPVSPALTDLYARGRYEEAIRAGEAARSATGYALAARAALADATLRDAPCRPCLERAEALARRAIAADPGLADGHVWLAQALGFQARFMGLIWARFQNIPRQGADALATAVLLAPDNPHAVASRGAWNIEVVKAAGPFIARLVYGATREQGLALFDRAIVLAPDNIVVRMQMAVALAGYDPVLYRARIDRDIAASLRAIPATAQDRVLQRRALALKAALDDARPRLDALVRRYQGYP